MDHAELWAGWFRNRASWESWRTFLSVLFGLAVPDDQLDLVKQCTGRSVASPRQAARIDSMVQIEWAAIVSEAEGSVQGLREGREHRRLLDRLQGDHQRSVKASQASPAPKSSSIADIIAEALSRC
jgi:hypothetical protein